MRLLLRRWSRAYFIHRNDVIASSLWSSHLLELLCDYLIGVFKSTSYGPLRINSQPHGSTHGSRSWKKILHLAITKNGCWAVYLSDRIMCSYLALALILSPSKSSLFRCVYCSARLWLLHCSADAIALLYQKYCNGYGSFMCCMPRYESDISACGYSIFERVKVALAEYGMPVAKYSALARIPFEEWH